MKNINNKFQEEVEHRGFSDIMVYTKDYPEDCFDPRDYFTTEGHFKFSNDPLPEIPPIKRLQEIDAREVAKLKNKNKAVVIYEEVKESDVKLIQCPICKHLVPGNRFELHVKGCMDKEKEEKEFAKKLKEENEQNSRSAEDGSTDKG